MCVIDILCRSCLLLMNIANDSKQLFFSPSLSQIILAILVSWLLCFIFTVTDVFPPDSSKYGFYARTDARRGVLLVAPWFKVPYPCKYVWDSELAC